MVQTIRQDVSRTDLNSDGLFDETTTTISELTDGRVDTVTTTNINTLYPHSTVENISYLYDDLDLADGPVHETRQFDWNNDGTWDEESTTDWLYDGEGHAVQQVVSSGDMDGDGVAGDYKTTITFTENFAGSVTEKFTSYEAYGTTNPGDYVRETWGYAADGQRLASHMVDNPMIFDCEITDFYNYNAKGQLSTIKQQNEIRFGDLRERTTDSFTWNTDGTPKTETHWAGHDNPWYQYAFRTDYTFTSSDKIGYDKTVIARDLTGDWDPEAVLQIEEWRNADGNLTHTLKSWDNDGNGGVLAGGFDSRDLTVATWVGNDKVAEYTDIGLDGILDSTFTSDFIVA